MLVEPWQGAGRQSHVWDQGPHSRLRGHVEAVGEPLGAWWVGVGAASRDDAWDPKG